MRTREILAQCKALLAQHYQTQFQGLVLYGSVARQQATPASDIDLLVLLTPPFDYFQELHTIIDLLYPVQLESDQLISAKPASIPDFEQGVRQFYRHAKREGVVV